MNHKLNTFAGYLLLAAGVLIVAFCGQCTIRMWANMIIGDIGWDALREGLPALIIATLVAGIPISFGVWLILTGWKLRAPEAVAGQQGPDPAGGDSEND